MRNIKRILGLICALALISSAVIFADDTPNTEMHENTKSFQLLQNIGIVGQGTMPMGNMTRGDFAELLVKALNANIIRADGTMPFIDVSKDHRAYNAIYYLYKIGIVSGSGDGFFNPDNEIKLSQAVTMCVNAVNLSVNANAKGGYPMGYMAVAKSCGLLDEVGIKYDDIVTFEEGCNLIFGMLLTEGMNITGIDENGNVIYTYTDTTILESIHNVTKVDGIVDGDSLTSLYDANDGAEGKIRIDGETYLLPEGVCYDYLGYRVEAYIKYIDEEAVAIGVFPYKTMVVTMDGGEIDEAARNYIEYTYETDEIERTQKIESNFDFIYNFKAASISDMSRLQKERAYITLIDNDRDGKSEVIVMREYEDIYVDAIASEDNTYYDINGRKSRTLDPSRGIFIKDGKEIENSRISVGDVISVFETEDKEYFKAYVTSVYVEGKIEKKTRDGVYTIGENKYKFAADCNKIPEVGYSGVFFLDIRGEIAAVEDMFGEGETYAYLIGAALEGGVDKTFKIKMYTSDGFMEIFEADGKIMVDGKTYTDFETVLNIFKKNESGIDTGSVVSQPVRFKTNGRGYLTMVDTLMTDADDENDCFERIFAAQERTYVNNGLFNLAAAVNTNAAVINIPNEKYLQQEEKYSMGSCGKFKADEQYTVEGFGIGQSRFADFALCYNGMDGGNLEPKNKIFVIEEIEESVDEDSEEVIVLNGYMDETKKSYKIAEDNFPEADLARLKFGTVMRISPTSDGYIAEGGYDICYVIGEGNVGTWIGTGWKARTRYELGKVLHSEDGKVIMNTSLGESIINISGIGIYRINTKDKKITPVSPSAVKSAANVGEENATTLFIHIKDGFSMGAVIID